MNYNGNDLKAIRQRNKLSQKEFGKLLGRNEADYQRVEFTICIIMALKP
jgi:DNA-binding transcriptional regulator YiaG